MAYFCSAVHATEVKDRLLKITIIILIITWVSLSSFPVLIPSLSAAQPSTSMSVLLVWLRAASAGIVPVFFLFRSFLFTKLGHSRGSEWEHEWRLKDNCRIILSKLRVNINTLNLPLGRVSNYNLQKNINESPLCFWHTLMRHRSFRGFVRQKITHGESRRHRHFALI